MILLINVINLISKNTFQNAFILNKVPYHPSYHCLIQNNHPNHNNHSNHSSDSFPSSFLSLPSLQS